MVELRPASASPASHLLGQKLEKGFIDPGMVADLLSNHYYAAIQTMAIDGCECFFLIEMRGIHHHQLAPGSQLRRRHVLPGLTIVVCHLNVAIVGPGPVTRRLLGLQLWHGSPKAERRERNS